jgi:hypothetical protein
VGKEAHEASIVREFDLVDFFVVPRQTSDSAASGLIPQADGAIKLSEHDGGWRLAKAIKLLALLREYNGLIPGGERPARDRSIQIA